MKHLQKLIELEEDARKFGFDWPDHFMILNQIIGECGEVREDFEKNSSREKVKEELGDLLHAVISLCIFSGFDVETILEKTNTKFTRRMNLLKNLTYEIGLENLHGQTTEFMINLWNEVKNRENKTQNFMTNKNMANILL